MFKICIYILVVVVRFDFTHGTSDEIFTGRVCDVDRGDCYVPAIDNGKYVDPQSHRELKEWKCISQGRQLMAICNENSSYFGRKNFTVECSAKKRSFRMLEHSEYCSDRNFVNYNEDKDCMVPLYKDRVKKWITLDSKEIIQPGTYIKENGSIGVTCNWIDGLAIYSTDDYESRLGIAKCVSGKWNFDATCLVGHVAEAECNANDCRLPQPPINSNWIIEESGVTLKPGICIKNSKAVTASCNSNYTYFGKPKFVARCKDSQWFSDGGCSKRSYDRYEVGKDCIVPGPAKRSKWVRKRNEATILAERVVKNGVKILAVCESGSIMVHDGTDHTTKCESGEWAYYEPTCLSTEDYFKPQMDSCKLLEHPSNGKWVDGITGKRLMPGIPVKGGVEVNGSCSRGSSFFGSKHWRATCFIDESRKQWIFDGFCSTSDYEDFQVNKDCVIPEVANNSKWFLKGADKEISSGTYVKEHTEIRAICNSDYEFLIGTEDVTRCESGRWTLYAPICAEPRRFATYCSHNSRDCILRDSPDNSKWIDRTTGEELKYGICVASGGYVNASCDNNYNYFGYKQFTVECFNMYFARPDYFCTDQNPGDFVPEVDCIVPRARVNSKWISVETNKEIKTGTYVLEDTRIRSDCLPGFTRSNLYGLVSIDDNTSTCIEGHWTVFFQNCE